RRHTRSKRDWSSDVCSSDLYMVCQSCGSKYKGKFEVSRDGYTECMSCNDKIVFGDIEKEKVKLTEERMLGEVVKDLLIKDVKRRSEERRVGKESGTRRMQEH